MGAKTNLIRAMALVAAAILGGCYHASPPPSLVSARATYLRAHGDPNTQFAAVRLHEAQQALEHAEASWVDEGNTPRTRDLSYVAQRRAQIAMTEGRAARFHAQAAQSQREYARAREQRLQETNRELSQARNELDRERDARAATEGQLSRAEQDRLQAEQGRQQAERRSDQAEQRADAALDSLRQMSLVREESRGTVITLSGAVLFAPNSSTLLPIAQQRLDEVAQALLGRTGTGPIIVEGHTDSRGSAARNEELSRSRAEAVVAYLVSKGVPTEQIRAVGAGSTRPVADNATAEGRANNRRVEIVIPPQQAG